MFVAWVGPASCTFLILTEQLNAWHTFFFIRPCSRDTRPADGGVARIPAAWRCGAHPGSPTRLRGGNQPCGLHACKSSHRANRLWRLPPPGGGWGRGLGHGRFFHSPCQNQQLLPTGAPTQLGPTQLGGWAVGRRVAVWKGYLSHPAATAEACAWRGGAGGFNTLR